MRSQHQHVLHVIPALFANDGGIYGGAERYVWELARHMALVRPTTLLTFAEKSQRFRTPEGLQVEILGKPWHVRGQVYNPIHYKMLRKIADAQIIHCHQPYLLASSLSALICRLSGRKVFTSDLGGGAWDISAYVSTQKWFHAHLHISKYSEKVSGHEGWNRSHVIYGGVDTEKFCPDDSVPKEPLVVFVGRLLAHKGINYLIEALPEGLNLEIIGRPYDPIYFLELQRLAVGKSVRLRTDCSDQDIILAYRRSRCVVLPSVYKDLYGNESKVPELLGQTLLGGMACGTLGICTDVASMPELIIEGSSGFIVPSNDPTSLNSRLTWIRDHPAESDRIGQKARVAILANFTWPKVVEHCLEIYSR